MFNIRAFEPTESDYNAIADVERAIWPENPSTVEDFKFADESRDSTYAYARFVVELAGQIVAFAHWKQEKINGRYRLNISVHPDFERRGVGTAVYNHLITQINQQTPAPTIIESSTYAHKPQAITFLQKRGFEQVMRWIISTLDVQSFDKRQFEALAQKIASQGIEILALPDVQKRDPNWQRNIYELDWACSQDEPLPYEPQKPPFELYKRYEYENPKQVMGAWFVAVENGRYVGMTQLQRADDPTQYKTGLTGTVRSHRRRGLATLLKAHAITYAKAEGIQTIRTSNEEHNPMYLLNQALGFKDLTANLAFEKKVANK